MDQSKSKEWHEARRSGIGGSDVAAALGVSPYTSQLELWGEKTGLVDSTFEGNEYTYWGTVMESLIGDRFVDDHPDMSIIFPDAISDKKNPCLRANVDGVIYKIGFTEPYAIWEAKTASREFTEVPVHYQLQVQHYMHIYNVDMAIISVLFGGNNYQEFTIQRDPTYASDLVPQLLKFWSAVEQKLPVFKPTNMADLKILIDIGSVPTVAMEIGEDNPYALTIEKIRKHSVEEKFHKGAGSILKKELSQIMIDQEIKSLKINGKAAATIVTTKDSKSFDIVRFKQEQKGLFDSFCTKTRRGYVSLRVTK